jgi:hypothetical protein
MWRLPSLTASIASPASQYVVVSAALTAYSRPRSPGWRKPPRYATPSLTTAPARKCSVAWV